MEEKETKNEQKETSLHEKKTERRMKKEEQIRELEKRLEEKTKEAEMNYDRFLRVYAEFENYKKRIEREKNELIRFANEDLIKELLPVIDNLERALEQAKGLEDIQGLKDGVELTLEHFLKILKKFGLEQLSALGEKFDPNKHEAIAVEESSEHEEGTVIKEHQKAYIFKERLIRPALVSVCRAKKGDEAGGK